MPSHRLSEALAQLDPANPRYATDVVERALAEAQAAGASDVHFQPGGDGLELRWRIDGVLQPVALLPAKVAPNVVARLKVLSELLTYRTDVPQEGRIRGVPGEVEMRVSTFPTLFGEKAVVRMFAAPGRFLRLGRPGLARRGPRLSSTTCSARPRARSSSPARPAAARRPRSTPACASWRPGRAASAAWRRWKIPIEAVVAGRGAGPGQPGRRADPRVGPEVAACGKTPRSSPSARSATRPPPRSRFRPPSPAI